MPHLAPALATKGLDLAGGVRWEIVVMHIAFAVNRAEVVELLRFAERAQRRKGQDLGLAAGEQAGTVGARGNTHFAPDRADVGGSAPIRTLPDAEYPLADDTLLGLVKRFADR